MQNYLCLGLLLNADKENKRWTCVSRKILKIVDQEATAGIQQATSEIEYEVAGPGIYAVILKPDVVVADDQKKAKTLGMKNYCGWVCQNKHDFVIYLLLAVPIIIWGFKLLDYL